MLGRLSLLLACGCVVLCERRISLDSDGYDALWTVKNANRSIKVAATIPGGIYTDLQNAGVLKGDLFYRFNDEEFRWVSKDNWTYYRYFDVPSEILSMKRVVLVFHGLDTVARVKLNGQKYGWFYNMFNRFVVDVKHLLKANANYLEVKFLSPILAARREYEEQARSYVVPPQCVPDSYRGECHINHLRKMQASFAWDWGPAFPSVGIWKSVDLEAYNTAKIRDVSTSTSLEHAHWNLQLKAYLELAGRESITGNMIVNLHLKSHTQVVTSPVVLHPSKKKEAIIAVDVKIDQEEVDIWWPNGFGLQPLYNVTLTFVSHDSNETSEKTIRIGFRTVELIQEPVVPGDEKKGLSFYFKVNGYPMFMKGSNWIPAHVLPERASRETIKDLLMSSKEAHMNMLRVWGGGIYEPDYFYELADELGILIWQDMMFACNMYPTNNNFLESVHTEIVQNVRRLQHHPSIAIWAGNNENEAALVGNWYGTGINQTLYEEDYVTLYVDVIRRAVLDIDQSRPFLVSSPTNGLESEREGYLSRNPYSNLYGDIHYYNYFMNGWNPNVYPRTRFSSEYGFQSMPSYETIAQVTSPIDRNLNSEWSKHRQHLAGGNQYLISQIDKNFNFPSIKQPEQYLNFIYISQINQAMIYKTQTEFYRRGRNMLLSTGEGNTMGALYWQLNDVWPAPSWSSIDFGGRWKMVHYYAMDFFSPVIVSPYSTILDQLNVYVISDLLTDVPNVTLVTRIFKWNSLVPLSSFDYKFNMAAASAKSIYVKEIGPLLESAGCGSGSYAIDSCFFHFSLKTQDKFSISPYNYLFPTNFKSIKGLQNVEIKVLRIMGPALYRDPHYSSVFHIFLSTDNVACFVWLEVDGIPGRFSENGFLMVQPNKTVKFYAKEQLTRHQLSRSLTLTAINNIA